MQRKQEYMPSEELQRLVKEEIHEYYSALGNGRQPEEEWLDIYSKISAFLMDEQAFVRQLQKLSDMLGKEELKGSGHQFQYKLKKY